MVDKKTKNYFIYLNYYYIFLNNIDIKIKMKIKLDNTLFLFIINSIF